LSLDELRSRIALGAFARAQAELCEAAELDPADLELPGPEQLAERSAAGRGYLRPELAVLLGVAKLVVRQALAASPHAAAPELEPLLLGYFPETFRSSWPDAIREHPLRREIAAMVATNRLLDAGGVTLVTSLAADLGVSLADAAAGALRAEEVLDAPARRAAILAEPALPRATAYAALLEIDRGVRAATRFLARSPELVADAEAMARAREGVAALRGRHDLLTEAESSEAALRQRTLVDQGLPAPLAAEVVTASLADRALNALRTAARASVSPEEAARLLARIGDATGIAWVHQRIREIEPADPWERTALADLRGDLLDVQAAIAQSVLAGGAADADAA